MSAVTLEQIAISVEQLTEAVQLSHRATAEYFGKVDGRMEGLEVRMDRLEGRMDRLEGRMDRVERRLTTLETRVDEGFEGVNKRLKALERPRR